MPHIFALGVNTAGLSRFGISTFYSSLDRCVGNEINVQHGLVGHPVRSRPEMPDDTDSQTTAVQDFAVTRVFDATREQIWSALTDPEQLVRFMGPRRLDRADRFGHD